MNSCKELEWIQQNKFNYAWYYENYPLRESGIVLPVSFDALKVFYIKDMKERNLVPQGAWLNCYSALFGYLLGRIEGVIVFEGRNWFQLIIDAIPAALGKTYNQLTSPFGIPIWLWFGGAVVLIVVLKS